MSTNMRFQPSGVVLRYGLSMGIPSNVLVANLKWFHFIVYTKASSSGMWLQRGHGTFDEPRVRQPKKAIDYMHKF